MSLLNSFLERFPCPFAAMGGKPQDTSSTATSCILTADSPFAAHRMLKRPAHTKEAS